MAVTRAREKHLGCGVHSLSGQANARCFRQMCTRAPSLSAGALTAWCHFSPFCALAFGIQPEAGSVGHVDSGIFRLNNKNIAHSSLTKASHLVIPALDVDGTITWCGRENRLWDQAGILGPLQDTLVIRFYASYSAFPRCSVYTTK